jgi:hypothetical protein
LVLDFDNTGKCTVSGPAAASYTLSGTGQFVKKGDMWGNEKKRCALFEIPDQFWNNDSQPYRYVGVTRQGSKV